MSLRKQSDFPRRDRPRRLALAMLAAMVLLLLSTATVLAQDEPAASPVPRDVLCVSGTVINHAEQPIPNWSVTAVYEGTDTTYPSQTITTDENGRFSFTLPGPGRWAFEAEVPEGWEPVTAPRFAVRVIYGSTECVEIRIKVRRLVDVVVYKIDDAHQPLAGWLITATPGPGNNFATVQTAVTNALGVATFHLTPGIWIFTETPLPEAGVAWWQPISPASGQQTIVVEAPGPYEIRFKNIVEKKTEGCINVIKQDVPLLPGENPVGLEGWTVQVLRANETIAREGVTNAFGAVSFTGLPLGPYIVREIMQPGWIPASSTSYNVVLTSQNTDCQSIIFSNEQAPRGFCIVGRKLDLKDNVGIPDWEIIATPLDANGNPDPSGVTPEPVRTDGTGQFFIDLPLEDYRVPGTRYQVCETVADGWTAVSPKCYTVTMPEHEDLCVETPDFVNRQTQFDGPMTWDPKPQEPRPQAWTGACSTVYVVKRGDGVYRIASMYHVSAQQIFQANMWIRNQRNNWLYVGQEICIP